MWERKGSAHSRGYGAKWRKLRLRILGRDKHLCIPCTHIGRLTPATEVDHVVNKADGGTDSPDNLQSICRTCHKAKTAREANPKAKAGTGCNAQGIPLDPAHHWG